MNQNWAEQHCEEWNISRHDCTPHGVIFSTVGTVLWLWCAGPPSVLTFTGAQHPWWLLSPTVVHIWFMITINSPAHFISQEKQQARSQHMQPSAATTSTSPVGNDGLSMGNSCPLIKVKDGQLPAVWDNNGQQQERQQLVQQLDACYSFSYKSYSWQKTIKKWTNNLLMIFSFTYDEVTGSLSVENGYKLIQYCGNH